MEKLLANNRNSINLSVLYFNDSNYKSNLIFKFYLFF